MVIQCKTRSIYKAIEEQKQHIGHFISLEKVHKIRHPELIACLPDEATWQSRRYPFKENEIVQMSKPSHVISCTQNTSTTLLCSTVGPQNLQHITEVKTHYETKAMKVAVLERATR